MEAITIPHVRIPSINIGGICLPGIGAPGSIGKKGLIWPAGMKEHIKAWYDPKKQGMTNFDVIESYAEDFTASKWVTVQDRAVFTKTASKIHITESMSDGFNTTFIETSQSRYGNEMKINVSGIVAGGVTLKYRYGSYEEVVDITSNGVYTLPAGKAGTNPNGYNGFVMKAKGKCDITITQLPTSILKDLSGNGNHAYLYGGKGKLNSGMGLYKVDFTSWRFYPSFNTVEYYHNKLVIKKAPDTKNLCAHTFTDKFTAKISNIPDGTNLYYRYYDRINKKNVSILLHNGINEIDYTNADGSIDATNMFIISKDVDFNITIEQIPDYPDQLCYDGKMYAVCYGFPILTDYTVMAERMWFEKKDIRGFITKGQLFRFEWIVGDKEYTTNMNIDSSITFPNGISYQTKTSYNGKAIISSTYEDETTLIIGKRKEVDYDCFIGCHGAIIVADRSFTEEEINWLKQNWDKI